MQCHITSLLRHNSYSAGVNVIKVSNECVTEKSSRDVICWSNAS